ncbi:hypothetical protein F2Q69_00021085 [Brassica cretica]|uniref:Uncharacterized protein n=1 Tax=Brassica cretica TaxID=69181 RepID=A0A8S9Q5R8_BRACR|nr:hypothetical protein F2Q69_00021085 [Brassica cretica]
MYRVKLCARDKKIRLLPDELRLRNLGLIFIISASSISDEPAIEFQDVVGDEFSGGISCSSFLRVDCGSQPIRSIMANPSIVLSDLQAFRCSSTVKVSGFRKRAQWRADGVDMLLLSWFFSHGELIATVYEIKMPRKSDGMKGYLSPCSRETHPLIFRSPVKGMEGILTNQLM